MGRKPGECELDIMEDVSDEDYSDEQRRCLIGEVEKWHAKYEHACARADRASAEADRLREEVERLTAESAERLAIAEDFYAQFVHAGRLLAARELEVTALTSQLSAMTKARDEACEHSEAMHHVLSNGICSRCVASVEVVDLEEIDRLRAVGKKPA